MLPPTRPRSITPSWNWHARHRDPPGDRGQAGAPERDVVCVTGDGAAGFNVMELQTAVREGVDVTVIVCAEGSWTMEEPNELQLYERRSAIGQGEIRWDRSPGPGLPQRHVDRMEDLEPAPARGLGTIRARAGCACTPTTRPTRHPREMLARFFEVFRSSEAGSGLGGQMATGQVAVITGAGSGIGAATARLLARHDATVHLADINGERRQRWQSKSAVAQRLTPSTSPGLRTRSACRESLHRRRRVDIRTTPPASATG